MVLVFKEYRSLCYDYNPANNSNKNKCGGDTTLILLTSLWVLFLPFSRYENRLRKARSSVLEQWLLTGVAGVSTGRPDIRLRPHHAIAWPPCRPSATSLPCLLPCPRRAAIPAPPTPATHLLRLGPALAFPAAHRLPRPHKHARTLSLLGIGMVVGCLQENETPQSVSAASRVCKPKTPGEPRGDPCSRCGGRLAHAYAHGVRCACACRPGSGRLRVAAPTSAPARPRSKWAQCRSCACFKQIENPVRGTLRPFVVARPV